MKTKLSSLISDYQARIDNIGDPKDDSTNSAYLQGLKIAYIAVVIDLKNLTNPKSK